MDLNEHALLAGRLLGNQQSLETCIRMTLANLQPGGWWGRDLLTLKEGDVIPEDPFSKWDYLGPLARAYNAVVDERLHIPVDPIVDLRNLLAHGRVVLVTPTGPVRMLKFTKPSNGSVTVTHCVDMTEEWFAESNRLLLAAQKRVAEAGGAPRSDELSSGHCTGHQ